MIANAEDQNVGFISTRFAGTDGVTLETWKWADVFKKATPRSWIFLRTALVSR